MPLFTDTASSKSSAMCFKVEGESVTSALTLEGNACRSKPSQQPSASRAPSAAWPAAQGSRAITLETLEAANRAVAVLPLPGSIRLAPVHEDCLAVRCAQKFGIPASSVVLGASYFQRLLQNHMPMLQLAVAQGYFMTCTQNCDSTSTEKVVMMRATDRAPTLLSVYVTCIYLALKVSDRVQHTGMLSAMLSDTLKDRVQSWQAAQLEMECLAGLQWRLGPYFADPQ